MAEAIVPSRPSSVPPGSGGADDAVPGRRTLVGSERVRCAVPPGEPSPRKTCSALCRRWTRRSPWRSSATRFCRTCCAHRPRGGGFRAHVAGVELVVEGLEVRGTLSLPHLTGAHCLRDPAGQRRSSRSLCHARVGTAMSPPRGRFVSRTRVPVGMSVAATQLLEPLL